jgi:hypothetical protein
VPALVTGNLICAGWSVAGTEEAGRKAKHAAEVLSDANAKTFLLFLGKQQIFNESAAQQDSDEKTYRRELGKP